MPAKMSKKVSAALFMRQEAERQHNRLAATRLAAASSIAAFMACYGENPGLDILRISMRVVLHPYDLVELVDSHMMTVFHGHRFALEKNTIYTDWWCLCWKEPYSTQKPEESLADWLEKHFLPYLSSFESCQRMTLEDITAWIEEQAHPQEDEA